MQFKLSVAQPKKEGFFTNMCEFLTTQNLQPLLPDRYYYLQTNNISAGTKQSKDVEYSESSDYVQIQQKEQPVSTMSKMLGGFGIKLNIQTPTNNNNSVRSSIKSSAGSLATIRTQKQNKIDKLSPVMSKITDWMYLSGLVPASDVNMLKENKITYVLNLCGDCLQSPADPTLKNFILLLKDAAWENITNIFYSVFCFITEARTKNEAVLIHCYQGVSRSASVVIAYLMFINDMTYEEAYAHARVCRPVVSPNTGFIYQLCNWWRDRHSCIYKQQRCMVVKTKYQEKSIIALHAAIEKDSAIRDIQGSHFVKCEVTSQTQTQPVVFRFSILQKSQQLFLLKKTETKLINKNKQYLLDPRFIYLVTDLTIGTCLIIGSHYNTIAKIKQNQPTINEIQQYFLAINQTDSVKSDQESENLQEKDIFQTEDKDLLEKFQASPVNINEFLKTQGCYHPASLIYEKISSLPFSEIFKNNLLNRIVEMQFFEKFSPHITIFTEDQIFNEINTFKQSNNITSNFSKIAYLLGKLQIIPQVQLKHDYIEYVSEDQDILSKQEIQKNSPNLVNWSLINPPKLGDFESIQVFETQQEFDQDYQYLEEKLVN